MRGVLNFFICFRSELATDEVVLRGTIRLDSKVRSQNVHFHDSFWREQTLATTKLFLSLTRIDFAGVAVSSRAVRISSRAVRVFPALSLRRVRRSYGTFSLMVFQGHCARGRTGHMIILDIKTVSKLLQIDTPLPIQLLGQIGFRPRWITPSEIKVNTLFAGFSQATNLKCI